MVLYFQAVAQTFKYVNASFLSIIYFMLKESMENKFYKMEKHHIHSARYTYDNLINFACSNNIKYPADTSLFSYFTSYLIKTYEEKQDNPSNALMVYGI